MAVFTQQGMHDPPQSVLDSAFFRQHGYTAAPVIVQCYATLRCPLRCTTPSAASPARLRTPQPPSASSRRSRRRPSAPAPRNLPHLEETFRLVQASGAQRWGVHLLLPEGRAKARRDLFPSAPQMRQLLKLVARKRREFPVALCDEMGYAGEWECHSTSGALA